MWRDSALLLDMLLAAREVRTFASGLDWPAFAADRLMQAACQHQLQVIGEAASMVSPEFRAAHAEIDWTRIIGLRHRLVHDYNRIDLAKIWTIINERLDPLIASLEPLVPPDDGGVG